MKTNSSLVFVAACFLYCSAFATLGEEKDKYRTMYVPYNEGVSVANVPRDSSAVGYGLDLSCGQVNISDFTVTGLRLKQEYYWQSKTELSSAINHYHCLFRILEVTYEVKCQNGLHYEGKDYLLGKTRKLNETYASAKEANDFTESAHSFRKHPLESLLPDGTVLDENGKKYNYQIEKLDEAKKREILARWERQRVSHPPYHYLGTPGKMPVPVLLVHGLNGNYGQWGVEPVGKKGDSSFQKGLVKEYGYKSGSFPDILARSQNLSLEEKDINSNGIYFYQAPGEKIEGIWEEYMPHWDSAKSQSRYLYKKLGEVLDSCYSKDSTDWKTSNEYKIDLVAHSQGGLVIREMLRGLRKDAENFPQGTANAANHINRVITVNTPHLGSALATPSDNLSKIEPELL
ncbi:MAG: putative lipase, partial [Fibromonadaceae bacterium]|nr:putative lipase [Fibromonadaceae bacterium]